jgi:hypothetical protein
VRLMVAVDFRSGDMTGLFGRRLDFIVVLTYKPVVALLKPF